MSSLASPSSRSVRNAWRAGHVAVAAVPRWARLAAYAIPSTVLPSSLWRIAAYTLNPARRHRYFDSLSTTQSL
jgi:hypothetical protein